MGVVALALSVGASMEEIRDILLQRGLTEYQAYLTYKAGELLYQSRQENVPNVRGGDTLPQIPIP